MWRKNTQRLRKPRQTPKAAPAKQNNAWRIPPERQPMSTLNTLRGFALTLMVLAVLLQGCSTLPGQQVTPPRIPPPPQELMTPPAPGSWLDSARLLFDKWQKLLTQPKDA